MDARERAYGTDSRHSTRTTRSCLIAALPKNARRHAFQTFHCRCGRCGEIASLLNLLALLARCCGLYLLNESKVPGGPRAAKAHCYRTGPLFLLPLEARAMALNHVTLD